MTTRGRGHYGPIAIGRDDLHQASLGVLRMFRGKLASIVDRNAPLGLTGISQIFLMVDSQPPHGSSGGALGGSDQYLTPDNLALVNAALLLGGELLIDLEREHPNEYLPPTEVGLSKEHVGQLLARVTRAIGRL